MSNTNLLALATELTDHDLLARIAALAAKERGATVELLAHLAALDSRPSLYASEGYGSLFTYCTHVLHLSEDAACNRIHAARACRRFPVILDLLARGALSVTTVRLLREHLTPENHEAVLRRASGRSRREIEALIAELAPRPDARPFVRRLPAPVPAAAPLAMELPTAIAEAATPSSAEPIASNPPVIAHTSASGPTSRDRGDFPRAVSRPVHGRQGDARQAATASGPSPARNTRRRSRRDLRSCRHAAAGESREEEAGGGIEAAAIDGYPSRDGYVR